MATFLDHLDLADADIAAHVCTPGALRPAVGDVIDPISVAIERPTLTEVIENGRFTRAKPVVWIPVIQVAVLVKGDLVDGEGRQWRLVAAATRPDDGRWWRAEVEDLGPLA